MVDARLYESDTFVLLESGQPEVFLTADELLNKLTGVLATQQDDLPLDLQRFPTLAEQAKYLLDSSCELDVGRGQFLQWYMVRLEK